jgi:hypothetical protein
MILFWNDVASFSWWFAHKFGVSFWPMSISAWCFGCFAFRWCDFVCFCSLMHRPPCR